MREKLFLLSSDLVGLLLSVSAYLHCIHSVSTNPAVASSNVMRTLPYQVEFRLTEDLTQLFRILQIYVFVRAAPFALVVFCFPPVTVSNQDWQAWPWCHPGPRREAREIDYRSNQFKGKVLLRKCFRTLRGVCLFSSAALLLRDKGEN